MNAGRWHCPVARQVGGLARACAVAIPVLLACTETDGGRPNGGGAAGVGGSAGTTGAGGSGGAVSGAASSGSASGGSVSGGSVSGGSSSAVGGSSANAGGSSGYAGSGGLAACEGDLPLRTPLGFPGEVREGFEGVVSSVTSSSLEIETNAGGRSLIWAGPSLASFLVGTEVTVTFVSTGFGGLAPGVGWAVVRGGGTTAATLSEAAWMQVGFDEGQESPRPAVPAGFPQVLWVNGGCCKYGNGPACDYGVLRATLGNDAVEIERGATAELGDFKITNLGALYTASAEYVFSPAVSILGPAPAEP